MLLKQIGVESVLSVARKIVVIVVCPFKTMDAPDTRAEVLAGSEVLLMCVASFI
jgi:3-keto-L-gulonate-6-phosphate decarboxylase